MCLQVGPNYFFIIGQTINKKLTTQSEYEICNNLNKTRTIIKQSKAELNTR